MNSLIIFETLGLVMLAQLYTSWDSALPDLKEPGVEAGSFRFI